MDQAAKKFTALVKDLGGLENAKAFLDIYCTDELKPKKDDTKKGDAKKEDGKKDDAKKEEKKKLADEAKKLLDEQKLNLTIQVRLRLPLSRSSSNTS